VETLKAAGNEQGKAGPVNNRKKGQSKTLRLQRKEGFPL
jgi:hypothetical protein